MKKLLFALFILTFIFSLSACKEQGKTQDEEIKEFVASKTEEEMKKNKESYENFLSMLESVEGNYEEAIEKNDESLYKESRKALGQATFNFDGIIKKFPQKISLQINDLIIEIDQMQEKKEAPENVSKKIKEIEDLINSVY